MNYKEKQRIEKENFDAIKDFGDFHYNQPVKVSVSIVDQHYYGNHLAFKVGKVIGIKKTDCVYNYTGRRSIGVTRISSERGEVWYYVDFGRKIEKGGYGEVKKLTHCGEYPSTGKRLRNYFWIKSTNLSDAYVQLSFNFE